LTKVFWYATETDTLTIKEFITKLQQYDLELPILFDTGPGLSSPGFFELSTTKNEQQYLRVNVE
jgi:hypothetical protein